MTQKNTSADRTQELSENLLINLSKRVQELEARGEKSHQRELAITKQLAESETTVQSLRQDIANMKEMISQLEQTVHRYVEIYGPLED